MNNDRRRKLSRVNMRRVLAAAAAVALALVTFVGVDSLSTSHAQAVAEGLPTWDDVQKAKEDEASAAAKVSEIETLIVQLRAAVEETRRAAEVASQKQHDAEQELEQAQQRLDTLEVQAEASRVEAEEAAKQAAAIVSQLYRSGGVDRSLDLFLEPDDETADVLLDRLARMEKATERNSGISDKAEQAMNSAVSLGEQAESARNERDRLHEDAVAKANAAAEAAAAALTRQQEQEAQLEILETQLAALKDTTTQTVSGYEERLQLEKEERERLAREAAERAREEAANGGGGGGGGGGVSGAGWRNPLNCCYWISAEWWGYSGHRGIDMAIGSWTPIYAASSGTVTYAGWNGDYGNVVYIDHGGGLSTRYAHQIQVNVWYGQWVHAGELIGYVGSTGWSTGPHLHFETLTWGTKVNPRPFMNDRGIWL